MLIASPPPPYVRLVVENAHPHISFWLDVVDKALKVIAVLLGGAWTLMHYLRGRTFKRRLEPGVSGQLFRAGGEAYLIVTCTLKNVGLAKCVLDQPGTWCEVQLMKTTGREKLRRFEIFRSHHWIESGEPVTDSVVLPLPADNYVALRMDLRVKAKDIVWRASGVIPSPDAVPATPEEAAAEAAAAAAAATAAKPAPRGLLGTLRALL